jgi:hypothetical protein
LPWIKIDTSDPAWLQGLVDSRCFPGVHPSYTREEALALPCQAFCPDDRVEFYKRDEKK